MHPDDASRVGVKMLEKNEQFDICLNELIFSINEFIITE